MTHIKNVRSHPMMLGDLTFRDTFLDKQLSPLNNAQYNRAFTIHSILLDVLDWIWTLICQFGSALTHSVWVASKYHQWDTFFSVT